MQLDCKLMWHTACAVRIAKARVIGPRLTRLLVCPNGPRLVTCTHDTTLADLSCGQEHDQKVNEGCESRPPVPSGRLGATHRRFHLTKLERVSSSARIMPSVTLQGAHEQLTS